MGQTIQQRQLKVWEEIDKANNERIEDFIRFWKANAQLPLEEAVKCYRIIENVPF